MLGRRPSQEDALTLMSDFRERDDASESGLFCVFDGHAGPYAAQYCANNIAQCIRDACADNAAIEPLAALQGALQALAKGYQAAVDELPSEARHCGTTALVVWIRNDVAHVANLGDTRAVLSRGGKAMRLSHDHKPRDDEERIRSLGGYVIGKV